MPQIQTSPKSLLEHQFLFSYLIGKLLVWIPENTKYTVTNGDFSRTDGQGHKPNSNHYIRLAADLNLFLGNDFVTDSQAHAEIGKYWKSLHPLCRWGGDFKQKDGNHYSLAYKGSA